MSTFGMRLFFPDCVLGWLSRSNTPPTDFMIDGCCFPLLDSFQGGQTPLHAAAVFGFPECAEILCRAKADVNAVHPVCPSRSLPQIRRTITRSSSFCSCLAV